MAVRPQPKTWVNGPPAVSAADLNLEVRDSFNFLLNPPHVHANRNVALNLATATWFVMTLFQDTDDFDNMHSSSVNPSRVTANTAGFYRIMGSVQLTQGGSPFTLTCRLTLNGGGTYPPTAPGIVIASGTTLSSAGWATNVYLPAALRLNAGDYVEMAVWHDHGANVAFDFGIWQTYLQASLVAL